MHLLSLAVAAIFISGAAIPSAHSVKECPKGYKQHHHHDHDHVHTHCVPCKEGSFQPRPGQNRCLQCPPGSYQPSRGQAKCLTCPHGRYQSARGQRQCRKCPRSFYQYRVGAKKCEKCPQGKYQNHRGELSCEKCPSGNWDTRWTVPSCQKRIPIERCESKSRSCGYAIKRNANTCPRNSLIFASHKSRGEWWKAFFPRTYVLRFVKLWNSKRGARRRYTTDFEIHTDARYLCAAYRNKDAFRAKTFACNAVTKTFVIQLRGVGKLDLCHVKAFGIPLPERTQNRLYFGSCKASSTHIKTRFSCQKAMDKQSKVCEGNVFFHSKLYGQDPNPWWHGRFNRLMHVSYVKIFNRFYKTTPSTRLRNFVVWTDYYHVCARDFSWRSFMKKLYVCNALTHSIEVKMYRKKQPLELCEVEVYGYEFSMQDDEAHRRIDFTQCSSSSSYDNHHKCHLAMDGKKSVCGPHLPGLFVSKRSKRQWWKGYFSEQFLVRYVNIYNSKGYKPDTDRLVNFEVSTDSGFVCVGYYTKVSFEKRAFMCEAVTSSLTIRLLKKGVENLKLCEVEAFGDRVAL